MKRLIALLLVCCLFVSAFSVSVFAADSSIVGEKWSCITSGKTLTVGSTNALAYVFDASLGMSGFGSSPIENIYSSFPGWSNIKRSTSSLYTLPAGSSIYYSVTISVSGFSGFSSSDNMPRGTLGVVSVTDGGGWQSSVASNSSITPSISSGNYIYSFSGTVSLKNYVKTYAASLFFVFNLSGNSTNSISGKSITCTVSSSNIYVKYLANASSASEDQINNTVNNIYNTVINNNTEVVAQITNVVGILNNLFDSTVTINAYLESLVGEINAMGDDLGAVLSYLQNLYNQLTHISQVVDAISDKLDISNGWFEQFAGHLVQIDTDVGLCSSYLQGIYNTLSKFIAEDTAAMVEYLNESNTNILEVLKEVQALRRSLGDNVGNQLAEIIKNLVSQGTSIDGIKSFVSTIKENSVESVKLLGDILEELKKVEAENTETNDRLKAIQDAIDGFEFNVSNAANNVLTSSDQKGLGALVSKLISHLLSVVDFVTDLFGGIFTSVPSTISAYNDCNSFWGDQKTYIYTPHQISGFSEQGGAGYGNSNTSVQTLFAEAEKYLGYPYVFGGSSPETSFDCSGFVCYALNHSGVYSIGRTTAQGLYNACTPVDRLSALPGDLVFFTGTYDCPETVSHVGFYAGDGKMLHCGDPIQYESIDTSYWQSHFYAFGRLSYNVESVSASFTGLSSSESWKGQCRYAYIVYTDDVDSVDLSFSLASDNSSGQLYYFDYDISDWCLLSSGAAYLPTTNACLYSLSNFPLPSIWGTYGYPFVFFACVDGYYSMPIFVLSEPRAFLSFERDPFRFMVNYEIYPDCDLWPSVRFGGEDAVF